MHKSDLYSYVKIKQTLNKKYIKKNIKGCINDCIKDK